MVKGKNLGGGEGARGRGGGEVFPLLFGSSPPSTITAVVRASATSSFIAEVAKFASATHSDSRLCDKVEKKVNKCSIGGIAILNKKEIEQLAIFMSSITECAREILDEIAEYEVVIQNNKKDQRYESMQRAMRKKRAKVRRVAGVKQ